MSQKKRRELPPKEKALRKKRKAWKSVLKFLRELALIIIPIFISYWLNN